MYAAAISRRAIVAGKQIEAGRGKREPRSEHHGVARNRRPRHGEGCSARRSIEEGGCGTLCVAEFLRPTDARPLIMRVAAKPAGSR